jgi:uncharacterized protein with HEPN domain
MNRKLQSVVVNDVIGIINKISTYTVGLSYQEFCSGSLVIDASLHNIQILGEAIKDIKQDARQKADTIPWNLLPGISSRLINENFEADPEAVWQVIDQALPELKHKLERLHKRLVTRGL